MKIQPIPIEQITEDLFSVGDHHKVERLYREKVLEPFSGLAEVMGQGQPKEMLFAQWGLSPELYSGALRTRTWENFQALKAAKAWERAEASARQALAAFEDRLSAIPDHRDIVFALLQCNMDPIPVQRGYSGFGAIPGWVMTVYGETSEYNLARVEGCTAHEVHHNIHSRVHPRNFVTWTVGEYMIMEGLAESFAKELYGEEAIGFWVTEFREEDLELSKRLLGSALDRTGFGLLRAYIFGDRMGSMPGSEPLGVPDFAGYALGYAVVQSYLERSGKSVVEATFDSAAEIIHESGFFDD